MVILTTYFYANQDHGGKVISASTTMKVKGKDVAWVGDLVSCPKKGHGVTAIAVISQPLRLLLNMPRIAKINN